MGWNAQPTRAVIFEDCRVPVADRLGEEGFGFKIAMAGLDGGRLNIAACSSAARSRRSKRRCLHGRAQGFGERLDEFQALQFRLADMATELEAARTFLWRAAAALDRNAERPRFAPWPSAWPPTPVSTSPTGRCSCAGATAISRFGVEKIVRDLRVHPILEGTNEIIRLIIARSLGVGE